MVNKLEKPQQMLMAVSAIASSMGRSNDNSETIVSEIPFSQPQQAIEKLIFNINA